MVYLSICLCSLQFLSSVSCIFLIVVFNLPCLIYSQFFLFDVIVNETVFLISLSESLLLVFRNTTYFCLLILHPATLLNSLMSSSSFLVASLGFSMCTIICKQWQFTVLSNLDSSYFFLLSDFCDQAFCITQESC